MTKQCKRCKEFRKETSFRTMKCRNGARADVCRKCYDTNQLKEHKRSPEQIESQRAKLLGRKYTIEHRLAISEGQKIAVKEGRHPWKINKKRHQEQDRHCLLYKIWKEKVKEYKGNKCEICGRTDRLHVHHVKSYYYFPELKFDVENGKILCISCHCRHHRLNPD